MAVRLTRAEAENQIAQINEHRDRAVARLQQLNSTQENMLTSSWQGDSATKYGRTSDAQNDDFHGIIQTLNHVVELGSHHIRSVAGADQNS